jgi:hypothetical protein
MPPASCILLHLITPILFGEEYAMKLLVVFFPAFFYFETLFRSAVGFYELGSMLNRHNPDV